MDYQEKLIQKRRDALWHQVYVYKQLQNHQGKRPDQVRYSLTVFVWCAVVLLAGATVGMAIAIWQNHL